MKKSTRFILFIKLLFVFVLQCPFFSCAQVDNPIVSTSIDTVDYNYLKGKYPLTNTAYLKQYESEVLSYEKIDNVNGIKPNGIVFTGSSTIKLWGYRIDNDMYPLPVVDRGFGGTSLIQNIYYFNRLVKPYSPLIEVFYCANDYGKVPNTVFEMFRYYEYLFHENFPTSILYYISTNPSICVARKAYINNIDSANMLIKNYIEGRSNTFYIDTFHSLMPNGVVDLSYYSSDSLHLNDKGYDLITSIIKPIIKKKYNTYVTATTSSQNDTMEKFIVFDKNNKELIFQNVSSNTQLLLYDTLGRILLNQKVIPYSRVYLNKLSKGLYIIYLKNSGHIKYTQKITV